MHLNKWTPILSGILIGFIAIDIRCNPVSLTMPMIGKDNAQISEGTLITSFLASTFHNPASSTIFNSQARSILKEFSGISSQLAPRDYSIKTGSRLVQVSEEITNQIKEIRFALIDVRNALHTFNNIEKLGYMNKHEQSLEKLQEASKNIYERLIKSGELPSIYEISRHVMMIRKLIQQIWEDEDFYQKYPDEYRQERRKIIADGVGLDKVQQKLRSLKMFLITKAYQGHLTMEQVGSIGRVFIPPFHSNDIGPSIIIGGQKFISHKTNHSQELKLTSHGQEVFEISTHPQSVPNAWTISINKMIPIIRKIHDTQKATVNMGGFPQNKRIYIVIDLEAFFWSETHFENAVLPSMLDTMKSYIGKGDIHYAFAGQPDVIEQALQSMTNQAQYGILQVRVDNITDIHYDDENAMHVLITTPYDAKASFEDISHTNNRLPMTKHPSWRFVYHESMADNHWFNPAIIDQAVLVAGAEKLIHNNAQANSAWRLTQLLRNEEISFETFIQSIQYHSDSTSALQIALPPYAEHLLDLEFYLGTRFTKTPTHTSA